MRAVPFATAPPCGPPALGGFGDGEGRERGAEQRERARGALQAGHERRYLTREPT